MILNKHNIKQCSKCRAKGNKQEIKTYSIMRHSPYYDYESFYLCDDCFKELEEILIKFLEPTSNETQEDLVFKQQKKEKIILGTCWYCGLQNDKKVMDDYKHEGFLFCDDKCIMEYIKAEREREEKINRAEQKQADKNISNIFSTKNLNELTKEGVF